MAIIFFGLLIQKYKISSLRPGRRYRDVYDTTGHEQDSMVITYGYNSE